MSTIIHPNHSRRHNRIPPFTTFLRTAINHSGIITPLTTFQREIYHSTAIFPPFQSITDDDPPDWNDHVLTTPPDRLTIVHSSNLLGLPEQAPPAHPTNKFHVIPLLGLLPATTHIAVHEYINMIHHKYCNVILATTTQISKDKPKKVTIGSILNTLHDEDVSSILAPYNNNKTLLEVLQDQFLQLLQSLIRKTKNLQKTISTALRTNQQRNVPSPKPTVKPTKRKKVQEQTTCDADYDQQPTKKRKRASPNKLPTYPCPGRWCTLRRSQALSYTISIQKKNCTLCTQLQLAVTIATTIVAHLICDDTALSLILEYTNIDPQKYDTQDIALRLSLRQVPLEEIRDILSNVISHTETKLYISEKLTFLPVGDALYETPDTQLQDLVLHLVAYACLLPTTPSLTREFPPLTADKIHNNLIQALDFCQCPTPCPAPNLHTNLCQHCSKLIPNEMLPFLQTRTNNAPPVSPATEESCLPPTQISPVTSAS